MSEPKKKKSRSGPSGKHKNKIRGLSGLPDEEWEAQAAHAATRGETWSEWVRAACREALTRQQARSKKTTE